MIPPQSSFPTPYGHYWLKAVQHLGAGRSAMVIDTVDMIGLDRLMTAPAKAALHLP